MGWTGAQIQISGGAIQNNKGGISLQQATVIIDGGALIAENASSGIGLWFGAHANIRHATIEHNELEGVSAAGGSVVLFGGESLETGTLIRSNSRNGVALYDASVAGAGGQSGVRIVENIGHGVLCSPAPAAPQITAGEGPGLLSLNSSNVFNNTSDPQINCPTLVVP